MCGGSFEFAGSEGDIWFASLFAGAIVDSTVNGLDAGPLYEAGIGGEGAVIGGARTQSAITGDVGYFVLTQNPKTEPV
jgi:hypothetical protein